MAGRGILFIAMILLLSPSLAPGQDQGPELLVEYNRGLLTLSVENVSLKHVLTAVAKETGISVWYLKDFEKPITTEFNDLPLQQGLRRILRGMNYALIYSPFTTGKMRGEIPSGVYVLSKQGSRSRQTFRPFAQVGMNSPRVKDMQRKIRQFKQLTEKLVHQ